VKKETAKLWIDGGIKIGVSLMGLYAMKKMGESIYEALFGGGGQPDPVKVNMKNIPAGWTPQSLVTLLGAKLEGYNLKVYPEVVQPLLEINEDQLRWVFNLYATVFHVSLPYRIQDEWNEWGSTYEKAVTRMHNMGLY